MMSVEGQLRMMAEMLSAYKNGWGRIRAESIKDQEKREEAERALQRTIWRMYKKKKVGLALHLARISQEPDSENGKNGMDKKRQPGQIAGHA